MVAGDGEPVAEVVPEGDAELGAGLSQTEEGISAVAAGVAARPAADLALGDLTTNIVLRAVSYVRKLVTELSGGVFGYLDSVLERHSFDEFGELI